MQATVVILCAALTFGAIGALAAEKKEKPAEKKPEPPRLIMVLPPAVTAGTTNKLKLRGQNLTNVTALRFTNAAVKAGISLGAKTKADVPRDFDARRVGDTQLEIELRLPPGAGAVTNYFTATSPLGESGPHPLLVLPAGELVEEKEPNGGFKSAQPLAPGRTLLGQMKEAADVDVFRFDGRAGQKVVIEVRAARLGAALDSLLTLHDPRGHILAVNDDAGGSSDSFIQATLPADGGYFISVIDAHDRGGPTHVYLLRVMAEP